MKNIFIFDLKILFFTAVFFSFINVIYARDITIVVTDSDLDLPLEGAVVRTRDGREYICGEDGRAVIQLTGDRQTLLQASYPGYENSVITIPAAGDLFFIRLRLSGHLQGRELIVEGARPGTSETRTGRSIAVSTRDIAQTAEIGIIEDVMNTIKLLPGVNYTGIFDAQPSIRGGHPGDMIVSFDGFYISNPYHWGGGFSIFDPRMVKSAQLSHGVFSSRYGHTISGLLKITSKDPSPSETMMELGINTSAANFNLSVPLFNKGGILFMGRTTYHDPVIELAKLLSRSIPAIDVVNFIRNAPYIRSGTVSGNYRFSDNLELTATGFFGMDGVSVYFLNSSRTQLLNSDTSADFDFTNYQGFFTAALSWNPRANMLLRASAGTGYEDAVVKGNMTYEIHNKTFTQFFIDYYSVFLGLNHNEYQYSENNLIDQSNFQYNLQGRIDFDWELSKNFLVAAGVQEMFSLSRVQGEQRMLRDIRFTSLDNERDKQIIRGMFPEQYFDIISPNLIIGIPAVYNPYSQNRLLTTSAYMLGEYSSNTGRLKAELGVRMDHFVLFGNGFTTSSTPVLNPRLNIDFNILRNTRFLDSLDISAGTGLFSSVNSAIFMTEEHYDLNYMKPNRSFTSVIGVKLTFPESISLNIEAYYKYIFDRLYIPVVFGIDDFTVNPSYDGEGRVWGIDVMLQKIQSRFWDGWLAYSYSWAKYRDPQGRFGGMGIDGGNRGNDWYFPSFHRFHNLDLVLNIKPVQRINIYIRFGLASGVQLPRRIEDGPDSYPVLVYDRDNPEESYFIEKFFWRSVFDQTNRTTPSLPMDVKFSIFGGSRNGRTRYEVYVAVENVLALLYTARGNTSFNQYTGQVDTGSNTANYEIPIPIPSFGFKFSY